MIDEKGIIQVEEDDVEMNAAIKEVRDTVDQFLKARKEADTNFGGLLTVEIYDEGEPENTCGFV